MDDLYPAAIDDEASATCSAISESSGTLAQPSASGGANWSGAAVNPETGILYVQSRNSFAVFRLEQPTPDQKGNLRVLEGRGAGPQMPQGLPLLKPPYSRMTAINMNTGDHSWMVPLGDGAAREHPMLEFNLRRSAATAR